MRLLTFTCLFVLTLFAYAAPPPTDDGSSTKRPTTSQEITGNDFEKTISSGIWFIKYYSPYCKHCQLLAPVWDSLSIEKKNDYPELNFGAVNCIADGDLCNNLEIKAYPVMQWFVDGVKTHEYGVRLDRDFAAIAEFIDARMAPAEATTSLDVSAAPTPPPPKLKTPPIAGPAPNPDGVSIPLTFAAFSKFITPLNSRSIGAGWFIKFYVPWCSHCQQMAPAWTELAREMKGKLNIAEVNCEVENKLCKDIKLRGYPTLLFFKGGERVEYDGLRGLGDLVSFAQKAVSAGVHEITSAEFDVYEKKEEVIFLYFYDRATTSEDFEALDRTALSLIGHAPLLKTNSEVLINRFRITSFPKLIVLRDGKASYYNALSPRDMRDHRRILSWMQSVWLPMVPELSAANSHQVMQGRTVVLAILDRTLNDFEQTKDKMKAAALEWLDVRAAEDKAEKQDLREKKESKIEEAEEKGDKRAIEKAKGIQVVVKPKKEVGFAWVDGVFWGRWCRGTYGVDVRETGPRIIINEQDEKRYWDVNLQGKPIQPTTENIIETLQAVLAGPPKIKPVSTVGRIETMYRASVAFIRSHPYGIGSFIVFVILAAALWLRRRMKGKFGTFAAPSFSLEKPWGSSSNGSDSHARQPSGKGASLGKFD